MELPAEGRAIDIGDYYGGYRRSATRSDGRRKRTLRDTIASTLAYYREHLVHCLESVRVWSLTVAHHEPKGRAVRSRDSLLRQRNASSAEISMSLTSSP